MTGVTIAIPTSTKLAWPNSKLGFTVHARRPKARYKIMNNDEFSLEDVLIILRRRIWYFLIPVLVIAPIGAGIVMALPAVYRAEGTILVESQQIPDELVRTTINAYAQERIQTIRQRVMTLNNIIEVADKYDVFAQGKRLSETERAQKIREQVNVSLITVERRGRSGDGTIAFTVAYSDRDPQTAYLVANELMTLFLAEDARTRTAGASNTTEFFEREAGKLRNQVVAIEQGIATFKGENADALPEHLDLHLNMLERASRESLAGEREREQLEEEKQFLQSQLISGTNTAGGLSAQLDELESQLARLRAQYHEDYPEIKAVKSEIASLRRQMAPSSEIQRRRSLLAETDATLTALERNQDASAEDLAAAEAAVEAARISLSDQIDAESRNGSGDAANAQTEARIAVIDNRIRMNGRREVSLGEQIEDLQARIAKTPAVERQLAGLMRDYDNMDREYQEIRSKQQAAQLAQNLEENQQAEKFSILEPANRPTKPSSPDRIKLMILALFAAAGAGGGIAMLAEMLFATIRGRGHISNIVGDHPIAVIPYIPDEQKKPSVFGFLKGRRATFRAAPEAL